MRNAAIVSILATLLLGSQTLYAQSDLTSLDANANAYRSSMGLKDYDSAIKYGQEALRLAEANGSIAPVTLGVLAHNLAEAHKEAGNYQEAVAAFDRAIELHTQAGEAGQRNLILSQVSRAQTWRQGKKDAGFSGFRDAEENARKWFGEDSPIRGEVLLAHAQELYKTRTAEPQSITKLLDEAVDVFVKDGENSAADLTKAYHLNGMLRLGQGRAERAVTYLDKALATIEASKNRSDISAEMAVRASLISALDRLGLEERCIEETQLLAIQMGEGDRRDAQPLVRYLPEFPMAAVEMRREGYVVFEFGVNEFGHVTDPVVKEAVPKGFFEDSVVRAFKKWRYAPKVVGGKPVASKGYETKFRFVIAQ